MTEFLVKTFVKDAVRVPDKQLYHTRMHFEWQQGEALYGLGQHEEGVLNLRGHQVYLHQANRKIDRHRERDYHESASVPLDVSLWHPLARLWHVDVSTNTVKSYLASSFRKLGISKRSELEKFMLR